MKDNNQIRVCGVCRESYEEPAEMLFIEECICDSCDQARAAQWLFKEQNRKKHKRFKAIVTQDYANTNQDHQGFAKAKPYLDIGYKWLDGEWVDGERMKHLGLSGGVGVGKTRLASLLVKMLIRETNDGITWMNSSKFQKAVRGQYRKSTEEESIRILASAENAPWLILDDIGRIATSKALADDLYDIIETRSAKNKSIIWTTNEPINTILSGSNIEEFDRDRIISRFLGHSNIINF